MFLMPKEVYFLTTGGKNGREGERWVDLVSIKKITKQAIV